MGLQQKLPFINRNLISLKLILFLFYGGLACLYSSLTPHMIAIGLNYNECRIILIVAPLVALIGPLVLGPVADKMAEKMESASGKYLRFLIATVMILAAIFYACLLAVPSVTRFETRRPLVSFGCDIDGAIIFQERCSEEKTCFHWDDNKIGSLVLTNCSYTCQNPTQFENLYNPWTKGSPPPPTVETSREDYDYDDSVQNPGDYEVASTQRTRQNSNQVYVEPPHICSTKPNDNGQESVDRCHVFTEDMKSLTVQATLRSATNQENETHSADWCYYPLDGFQCNVPLQQAKWMSDHMNNTKCKPMVECEVYDPYDNPGSVLAESQCMKVIGSVEATFWSYLVLRSFADLFTASVVTLLNAAIIIATRETSCGRGDFGRQLAWGSLGWAIFPFIIGLAGVHGYLLVPVIVAVILMAIAVILLLLSTNMPVSSPEWWWHTKSGLMAIPMSAIRKYDPEISLLSFVAIVLGVFWSVIDFYQPWHLIGLNEVEATGVLKFTLTVAALPAVILLWHSERLVNYCGHSNILMASFAVYILRYTGLGLIDTPWWALFMAAMEPITLSITWVTLILYMRHLVPRRSTATAQALPVVTFFCVGKSIGAILGMFESDENETKHDLYVCMAIAACFIAAIYFMLYHFMLAPKCAAASKPPPSAALLQTHDGVDHPANGNGNGHYSPLRVYHNGRGDKAEFRY